MKCKRCNFACKKVGKQSNGKQKYRCKSCGIYQQSSYIYQACTKEIHEHHEVAAKLIFENVSDGMRSKQDGIFPENQHQYLTKMDW